MSAVLDAILFPPHEAYATHLLAVDAVHTLYVEESGNPNGVPVLFLHGGPGAGTSPLLRRFFDPASWHIILFDQRGCGKSTPTAELQANTPAHLISDIEHIRQHLRIERWHVFGGSWGSTLALAYAAAHAPRVLGLMLRGIFLMRESEINWFMHGLKNMRPDLWAEFTSIIPPEKRGADLLPYYYELLTNPDPHVHLPAARLWARYEESALFIDPSMHKPSTTIDADDLAIARIEAHYFLHNRFKPDDWLLQAVPVFRHIPAVIVQGQYDLICPPVTAYELQQAWPEAEYILVPNAGHSSLDPALTTQLVAATERFKLIR